MRMKISTLLVSIAVLLFLIGFAVLPAAGLQSSSASQSGSSQTKKDNQNQGQDHASNKQPGDSGSSAKDARSQPSSKKSAVVWVNTVSKVYHRRGSKWYGKTRHGKYMTEGDAIRAGYHAADKE
jgi:hypothetical protein